MPGGISATVGLVVPLPESLNQTQFDGSKCWKTALDEGVVEVVWFSEGDKRERRKASNRFNGLDSRLGGTLHCYWTEQPVQILTTQILIGPNTWIIRMFVNVF